VGNSGNIVRHDSPFDNKAFLVLTKKERAKARNITYTDIVWENEYYYLGYISNKTLP